MKIRHSRWLLAALSQAALASSVGYAQTGSVDTLPEVVVTANRSAQSLTDALPHTTVIGRDVIDRSSASDLPNLLASEAGFQFTQNGGPGTASTLFLRGSASMQVLVLVDGVALTKQDTTGTVSLEHIMLDQIERVEIVRGNVSAIYGSGAIGGVIQIFTRVGSGEPSVSAQVEVGSYGSSRIAAGIRGQADATRYVVGVGKQVTSGFSANNIEQYPTENPDADGYRNSNYNLGLSHQVIKGHTLGLRAQGSDGRFETDGGGFGAVTDIQKGRSKLDTWAVYSHNQITADWRSELTYSEGRERSFNDSKLTAYPYESEATSRSQTLNISQFIALGSWLVSAGAERHWQKIDSSDSYPTTLSRQRGVNAYWTGLTGKLGLNSIQLNLRRDSADSVGSESTAYAGYGYQVTPDFKLIASLSSAFNLPPLGYLYDPSYGNPGLKPETATSKELGLQWATGPQVLRATYFDTRTEDLLLYNSGTKKFGNISSASNKGVEVSLSGNWFGAELRSSLTLQDAMNESTGKPLVRRPRVMASLGGSKPVGRWTLGGDVRHTGVRPDTSGKPDLAAYTLVNLSARYALSQDLAITSRLVNLLDRKYQTAYGYNQSGRAFYLGASWSPK